MKKADAGKSRRVWATSMAFLLRAVWRNEIAFSFIDMTSEELLFS